MHRLARHWNVVSRPNFCRAYAARPPRLRPGVALKEDMQVQPDQPTETYLRTEEGHSKALVNEQKGELASSEDLPPSGPAMTEFPDLMQFDPLMDSRDVLEFPPDKQNPYGARVISRNDSDSIFKLEGHARGIDYEDPINAPEVTDAKEEELSSAANVPISPDEMGKLYRFPILTRRITQQTGKGKIHRMYSMYIVGNGNGLVGLGEAKDDDVPRAQAKAFAQAVRNMDWVERFEDRTVWTDMETKFGATRILMRPRPVGFGLRCNPNIHQVLKAAGIKDVSAKVWGSRNKINVIKATFRMLQGGNAPLGMGDGIGGIGRKLAKGSGAIGMGEVERQRGRKLIPLRR